MASHSVGVSGKQISKQLFQFHPERNMNSSRTLSFECLEALQLMAADLTANVELAGTTDSDPIAEADAYFATEENSSEMEVYDRLVKDFPILK